MNKVIKNLVIAALVIGFSHTAGATRPCGQQSPCQAIELDGPVPNPTPVDDSNANANFPNTRGIAEFGTAYIEEEYFISGTANVFNYNQPDALRGDFPGQNLVVRTADLPYKTRIIVKRPVDAKSFNGTVIIEAMNSTAGFETQPVWVHSAEYYVRSGIVFVEVTTSGNQALPYLTGGCGLLAPSCGSRYESLSIPDNGQEYEIISQLATALKSTDPGQVPLPANFAPVQRVFFTGHSQQGGSVVTQANQFHFAGMDGYFVQGASGPRQISGNRVASEYCGAEAAPPYPDCIANLAADQRLLRTNLPVPVYQGMSETDVKSAGPNRQQADADTSPYASYRLVEIPGTSHVAVADVEVLGVPLRDLCLNDVYTFVDGPVFGNHVFNAYWAAMEQQHDKGILPPYAPRILFDAEGEIARDLYQNALGGVRLPEFEYPTYSYFSPNNTGKPFCRADLETTDCVNLPVALEYIGNLACRLLGSAEPFSEELIDQLYPVPGRYVRNISDTTLRLAKQRFLLKEDARPRLIKAVQDRGPVQ